MFTNIPFLDFTIEKERNNFQAALDKLETAINKQTLYACPIISGEEIKTKEIVSRIDPSDSTVTVGKIHYAGLNNVEDAIGSLMQGFPAWRATHYEKRAEIIKNAGALMSEDRYELSALIVREAGKPWKEADADVCEAIDFCNYYAQEMLAIGRPQKLGDRLGELNYYFYQPRGISVVISPWNFPLAIACGMVVAALVTGNATILKPAEQSSLIAHKFAQILLKAGVPRNVFACLPGIGETIGAKLVDDPRVDIICFTGSKSVGLNILKTAAQVKDGQHHIKRVITELGGKNAIIVDEDADLDESIKGVLYSAFGYSGQKCSACSRVIVVGDAYETFLNRLCSAAKDVITGKASDPATLIGPVIDQESRDRILKTIEQASKENSLAFKGSYSESGCYVPATIFKDVKTTSSLWKEEIFGPAVAVAKAENFDQALQMANDSQYALTGAVFSRSPVNIDKAREDFRVGNLYINRGSTGALVYRQPFGGFKLSGIGSKAGGPDYLLQFVEPRVVTENTMRRGFSPDLG